MIGSLVGSYRVLRELGRGGMGAVYEVSHETLGRRAAMKVLLPEFSKKPEIVTRFINEARAVNIIQHPGIVDISELGTLPTGEVFILMEFLGGESLGKRLERAGRLAPLTTLHIAAQVAAALAAAHQKGIVHRDLKPDNVMLLPDPLVAGGERTKLVDFGIAKLAAELSPPGQGGLRTGTGVLMGTPTYMSPEQCRGAGGVGDRSDVYSLGVMLFQMLLGRPPFTGTGPGEVMAMHLMGTAPPMPGLAPPLAGLIERMMAKTAAARPAMAAVAEELTLQAAALAPPVGATPPPGAGAAVAPKGRITPTPVQPSGGGTVSQAPRELVALRPPRWGLWVGLATLGLIGGVAVLGVKVAETVRPSTSPPPQPAAQPPPQIDPDREALTVLADIDKDLQTKQWATAGQKAEALLKRSDLSPTRREAATLKGERAVKEQRNQELFERFRKQGGGQSYDEALASYQELPKESVYRGMAKEDYEKIFPLFVTAHLERAEKARRARECVTFKDEVQRVLAIEPRHPQALAALEEPCGEPAKEPALPAPPARREKKVADKAPQPDRAAKEQATGSSELDEETYARAQNAYVNGDYQKALDLLKPYHSAGAWRIRGGVACHQRDLKQIREAYRRLNDQGRQFLTYTCARNGVSITNGEARLTE